MKRKLRILFSATAAISAILLIFFNKCVHVSSPASSESPVLVKETESVSGNFISPFSKKFNVAYTEYTFFPGRDTVITHYSGTKITIPSCAFLNLGSQMNEPVKIKYREMMNRGDIIAAGIPMKVTENSFLETTGMMEFVAVKAEHKLNPASGCKVKFEMVNTSAGNDVNLYFLDTVNRNWMVKLKNLPASVLKKSFNKWCGKKVVEKTPKISAKEASIYFVPAKPKLLNPSRFGFHFKIDLSKYPEVNVYDGIVWEYAGKGGQDDPGKHPWVKNAQWKEMYIFRTEKNEVFRLKLISRDKTFETIVRPVFEKEDMEYAMDVFNDRYSKYRNFINQKKEEERKWRAEQTRIEKLKESINTITRTFEIDQLGIWNCDRLKPIDNPVVIALNFSTVHDSVKIEKVYLVDPSVNSVFAYKADKNFIDIFKIQKGKSYKMILLDSQAKVHKVSAEDISSFYSAKTSYKLNVLDSGKEILSMEELKKLI